MARNHYTVLGIMPTATTDEIKSAYRTLAKRFHPDHDGLNDARFLQIQEAYEVLGDPASRSSYDLSLDETESASAGLKIPLVVRPYGPAVEPLVDSGQSMRLGTISPRTSFLSYFPSFDEIFDNLWNALPYRHAVKSERFRTMKMEVLLTRDQARRGGQVAVDIPLRQPCSTCDGLGDSGSVQCLGCDGSGWITRDFALQITYPPGIHDLYEIAIPLDRYGIPDVCPILRFRISHAGDFEDYA